MQMVNGRVLFMVCSTVLLTNFRVLNEKTEHESERFEFLELLK